MLKTAVEVVAYDSRWPLIYASERALILSATSAFVDLEHIGSTAVPNQRAKPIIDMMAAVISLKAVDDVLEALKALGYSLLETDMKNRLFLRKEDSQTGQVFHLHIVEQSTWPERKERLMRDYLLAHPETAKAYGELKDGLAIRYKNDSLAYTEAKTSFIQEVFDRIQDERGLPRESVWED